MPDESTTATVEAPSSGAPSVPAVSEQPVSGGDALGAQLEALLTKPKELVREVPEPGAKQPAKSQEKAKQEAAKSSPEKQVKGEPEKAKQPEAETNFAKLRKKVADIEAEYAGYKNTAAEEQEKLKRQISVLETRKVLTPELEKRLEDMQKRLEQSEAQLYAFDYSQSPEYKDKYASKWEKRSRQAATDVAAMQVVTGKDEESGKETYRQATVADWQRVYSAASTPEAWRVARELFGDQATIAMEHRNALKSIEEQAGEEVESKRKNFDAERKRQGETFNKFKETHDKVSGEYDGELVKKYGSLFTGDPARPEEAKMVESGTKFVDEALNANNLSVEEHARRAAVLRRWAISFPLMNDRVNFLQGKIKSLEEELSKFRKSDPGEAAGEPTPAAQPTPAMGSDELAKQIEEKFKR